MAKNYVQDGKVVDAIAPAGGVTAGTPVLIGTLMLIPLVTAVEGATFSGATDGVWQLPCTTGLTAGAMVKWDATNSILVADSAKDGDDFGKLTIAESGGYANALLVQ